MVMVLDLFEVFYLIIGKVNFYCVMWFLISGGIMLLREIFDFIYFLSCLLVILKNLIIEK